MRPYEELTEVGRRRRMHRLARAALDLYGLGASRVKLVALAGNALYRVDAKASERPLPSSDLFEEGQLLLRLHWPGYRTAGEIDTELLWLAAMRREKELPVPEPLPTLGGELLATVSVPGVPEARQCSLLRWVKGRRVGDRAGPHHYGAQGHLMAQLHDFAATWPPARHFTGRRYDWEGLFKRIPALCLPVTDVWSVLPEPCAEPFVTVARRVRGAMEELGQGQEAFGLIHADLGVDANLLFWRGSARAIDFDESGLGYWMYDLAVALEHCREDEDYPRFRDALLAEYARLRPLPDKQLQRLDLFMAALDVHLGLWANAMVQLRSPPGDMLRGRFERTRRLVTRYLDRG